MEGRENIEYLRNLGFEDRLIKRIIADNPVLLSRSLSDLKKIVAKLQSIGLTDIVDLVDANPYVLNIDAYEVDNYIEEKQKSGLSLQEISEELESQPALFFEVA